MTMKCHEAGVHHVQEVTASNAALIEKAFRMRCASYLAHVKSQLLTQTIFEIDISKKDILRINRQLSEEIEQRKVAEQRLIESEARFRDFADTASDWLWECDENLVLTYVSDNCEELLGVSRDRIIGRKIFEVDCCEGDPEQDLLIAEHRQILQQGQPFCEFEYKVIDGFGEERYLLRSGKPRFNVAGDLECYRGSTRDVTRRRRAEEENLHLANHDSLTELPVLRLVKDRADIAIKRAKRNNDKVAVLFIDVDNFKTINDEYGHCYGDQVLIVVAQRLKKLLRGADTLGRIGGDEFIIIIGDVEQMDALNGLLEKVVAAVSQPFSLDGKSVTVGISIGVSSYPDNGDELWELKGKADQAMYQVKRSGKNGFGFYQGT